MEGQTSRPNVVPAEWTVCAEWFAVVRECGCVFAVMAYGTMSTSYVDEF
jgi:hypothetical protein